MNEEILYTVVKKLIGNINPVGCTRTDDDRLENLKVMCELADKLLTDIDDMAYNNRHSHEHSVKVAVEYAKSFYDKIGIKE